MSKSYKKEKQIKEGAPDKRKIRKLDLDQLDEGDLEYKIKH